MDRVNSTIAFSRDGYAAVHDFGDGGECCGAGGGMLH